MKHFLVAASLALICIGVLPSCKKDKTPPPVDLSNTSWNGSGTVSTIAVMMNVTLNSNGTITGAVVTSGNFAITGTWNKSPSSNVVNMSFSIVSVPGTYTAQATLNGSSDKLENGVGTNSTNATYNMVFSLAKN